MLIFDIDNTLSPALPPGDQLPPLTAGYEEHKAWGFTVAIPTYLVTFLRFRQDIVLLSTWDENARLLAEAFAFSAQVAVMGDFTEKIGLQGKAEVIRRLRPAGWADDHITPALAAEAAAFGTVTATPKNGFLTESELELFATLANGAFPEAPASVDLALLRSS